MSDAITQLLADARSEARALGRHAPSKPIADAILDLCDKVDVVTARVRRFLNESDAMLYSGKKRAWLRARYAEWAADGDAQTAAGVRYYLMVKLPHRADLDAARQEANAA